MWNLSLWQCFQRTYTFILRSYFINIAFNKLLENENSKGGKMKYYLWKSFLHLLHDSRKIMVHATKVKYATQKCVSYGSTRWWKAASSSHKSAFQQRCAHEPTLCLPRRSEAGPTIKGPKMETSGATVEMMRECDSLRPTSRMCSGKNSTRHANPATHTNTL